MPMFRASQGPWVAFRMTALVICTLAFAFPPLTAGRAAAAEECADLPASQLEVYDMKTPPVEELAVDAEALDQQGVLSATASRHTLMLTTHDVAMVFEITHRIIPGANDAYCDAPSLVRIIVGFPKRNAYIARQAAEDSCIRAVMLAHEADHRRADADALRRLLSAKQDFIAGSVAALKRTSQPSPEAAVARWEAGLRTVLESVKQDFLAEEAQVTASVDTPAALRQIENACGGKVKRMESATSRDL